MVGAALWQPGRQAEGQEETAVSLYVIWDQIRRAQPELLWVYPFPQPALVTHWNPFPSAETSLSPCHDGTHHGLASTRRPPARPFPFKHAFLAISLQTQGTPPVPHSPWKPCSTDWRGLSAVHPLQLVISCAVTAIHDTHAIARTAKARLTECIHSRQAPNKYRAGLSSLLGGTAKGREEGSKELAWIVWGMGRASSPGLRGPLCVLWWL